MQLFKQSFFDVIQNTIGASPTQSLIPLKKGYTASIKTLEQSGKKEAKKEIILLFNTAFLRIVAEALLGEQNPNANTLNDLTKELANLVVGKAKVLNQESKKNFDISTPDFFGIKVIKNYNNGLHFRLKSGRCSIFMREINTK